MYISQILAHVVRPRAGYRKGRNETPVLEALISLYICDVWNNLGQKSVAVFLVYVWAIKLSGRQKSFIRSCRLSTNESGFNSVSSARVTSISLYNVVGSPPPIRISYLTVEQCNMECFSTSVFHCRWMLAQCTGSCVGILGLLNLSEPFKWFVTGMLELWRLFEKYFETGLWLFLSDELQWPNTGERIPLLVNLGGVVIHRSSASWQLDFSISGLPP